MSSRRAKTQTLFAGSIADVSIGDLFQTLEMAAKPARAEFDTDIGRGTVWFREREVVGAECGGFTGADAIYRLAMADEGNFVASFKEDDDEPQTLQLSPQRLLMEAARRRDEWLDRAGEGLRPATRVVPVPRAERGALAADAHALALTVGAGAQLVDLIPPGAEDITALFRALRACLEAEVLRVVDPSMSTSASSLSGGIVIEPISDLLPVSAEPPSAPPVPAEPPPSFWVGACATHVRLGEAPARAMVQRLALGAMLLGLLLALVLWSGRVFLAAQLLGWALLFVGHAAGRLPQLPFRRPLLALAEPVVLAADALDRVGVPIGFVARGRELARRREG